MYMKEACKNQDFFKLLVEFLDDINLYKSSLGLILELLTISDDDLDIEYKFISQNLLLGLEKLKLNEDDSVQIHLLAIIYNLTVEHIDNTDYYCSQELIMHAVNMIGHHNNDVK